jgi:predicted transcriptional regulator
LNPITVTKDIKLNEALKLIVDNHIHRLWVVNEEKKVENVVSLTDLIKLFLQA